MSSSRLVLGLVVVVAGLYTAQWSRVADLTAIPNINAVAVAAAKVPLCCVSADKVGERCSEAEIFTIGPSYLFWLG